MVDSNLLAKMLFHDANFGNEKKLHKLLHVFYYKIEETNEKLTSVNSISLCYFLILSLC